MKKIILIMTITVLFITACDNDNNYPSLKVVNGTGFGGYTITQVSLVGYEFNSIYIVPGSSQTFFLDKGMPGGYSNILVRVKYGPPGSLWYVSNNFNFSNGKTRTVTFKGSMAEGSPDYLKWRLE